VATAPHSKEREKKEKQRLLFFMETNRTKIAEFDFFSIVIS